MGCTSWPYHLQGPPAGGEPLSMGVPATGTPMTPTVQFRLRIPCQSTLGTGSPIICKSDGKELRSWSLCSAHTLKA